MRRSSCLGGGGTLEGGRQPSAGRGVARWHVTADRSAGKEQHGRRAGRHPPPLGGDTYVLPQEQDDKHNQAAIPTHGAPRRFPAPVARLGCSGGAAFERPWLYEAREGVAVHPTLPHAVGRQAPASPSRSSGAEAAPAAALLLAPHAGERQAGCQQSCPLTVTNTRLLLYITIIYIFIYT